MPVRQDFFFQNLDRGIICFSWQSLHDYSLDAVRINHSSYLLSAQKKPNNVHNSSPTIQVPHLGEKSAPKKRVLRIPVTAIHI